MCFPTFWFTANADMLKHDTCKKITVVEIILTFTHFRWYDQVTRSGESGKSVHHILNSVSTLCESTENINVYYNFFNLCIFLHAFTLTLWTLTAVLPATIQSSIHLCGWIFSRGSPWWGIGKSREVRVQRVKKVNWEMLRFPYIYVQWTVG